MSKETEEIERRSLQHPVNVEKRGEGDDETHVVRGLAAKFNSVTDLGWFREEIMPGAFDDAIAEDHDVRALFNHEPNLVLARTKSGTLTLSVDDTGLWYEFEMPNRSYANDLADMLRTGDVSQSSFAFSIAEENWIYSDKDDESTLRQITKIRTLYDVAPVTYPAYDDTEVNLKSSQLEAIQKRGLALRSDENSEEKENSTPRLSTAAAQIQINKNKS